MTLSEKNTGTGEILLVALQAATKPQFTTTISYNGVSERRRLIHSWTPEELVRAYTALREKVMLQGVILLKDKILLESMETEGIEKGGKHSKNIQSSEPEKIPHGQGLTTTRPNGEKVAGWTRLSVWKVININK